MTSHHISFRHALAGLKYAFLTQPNFRVHLGFTILVVTLGKLFHLTPGEWLILLFTIGLVLVAEMVNTAIEATTDLLTATLQPQAKIVKDVSAGMVLLTAIIAIVVGLVIFIPKILWPFY